MHLPHLSGLSTAIPLITVAAFLLVLMPARTARPAETVALTIDPDKVLNHIDEKIYGQFLEHIYHSVNGGLWGELIWNRTFEDTGVRNSWKVDGPCVVQSSRETNVRLTFGDAAWRDYEFTLEAQKTGGEEGFLVLFRAAGDEEFYWCNIGGWKNLRHGLERGRKGERWHGVGKSAPGAIETGKWYAIRVRCEGPHFQVWLDGKEIIDFTDDANAHLTGKVGIGTWATQARFRNLKVTSLDGKVLFEGLPEMPGKAGVAKFWQAYGPGKVSLVSGNALNGEWCEAVTAEAGETGLKQTPLCVRKGETYRGSFWVRGSAPDGLVARLLDGQAVLAETALPAPTGEWREVPVDLTCGAAAENATFQIGVRGRAAVWIDQVSLMPESWRAASGFRPDLLKAIADLRPPVIRWPGGCFASYYLWKDGIGPQHKRLRYPLAMWDDLDVNSFGTDEFIRMCRAVGAEPLIVINIGMHDAPENRDRHLRDACDWVEYCNGPASSKWGKVRAENGHPEPHGVKFWEIDNEVWKLNPDDYARVLRQFVPAMKKVDPSITVLACGSGQLGALWADGDRAVIRQCADIVNYLSVHHYEDAKKFADGPAAAEKFWRTLAGMIAASANPKVKLYVSEWNAQSTDWRTGLYAGGALNVFEKCGDFVGMAGPALFLRHTSARNWDNAFINFDHRTWFPAPNYVVMRLWRDHYAPHRVALAGSEAPLNAVATKSADGLMLHFKAVNPAPQAAPVKLTVAGGFVVGKATVHLVAPGSLEARNTLDKADAVRVEKREPKVEGQAVAFTLPPLSAAVVTIEKR
jgi:alpha-N-arabinofuranosidase